MWTETNARRPARRVRSAWNRTGPAAVKRSRMSCTRASSSAGSARSISPPVERRTSETPVTMMLVATASAISLQCQRPVLSPGSDEQSRHAQIEPRGQQRHRDADADIAQRLRVQQAVDRRHADRHRGDQDQPALDPGREIIGLLVPVRVLLVRGRAAHCTMSSANTAATRLTTASAASESRPTEPVSAHAAVLSAIVARAAAIRQRQQPHQPPLRRRIVGRAGHADLWWQSVVRPCVTTVGLDGRCGMRYRRLGSTELNVSVVGLGTWQFSGEWGKPFTQPEVDALVGRARELGVNLIDTAECYGDHLAESLIGHAIAPDRERWIVATKFGHRFHADRMQQPGWDPVALRSDHWSPDDVVRQLEDSLRALGTEYVDIYQSHGGTDEQFAKPGLWEVLGEQVKAGKIRHLGISLNPDDGARAERARDAGAEVIQVAYNRLNRVAEERVLPAAAELGLGVLAREPLANGYLSGKYRPGRRITDPGDWRSSRDPQEAEAELKAVAQIEATEVPPGVPLARWALAWCLQHPAVSAVIPGSKNVEQLDGNVAAADLDLVPDEHPLAVPG
jgi:myo-inositol catabolism protein IolS